MEVSLFEDDLASGVAVGVVAASGVFEVVSAAPNVVYPPTGPSKVFDAVT
jgi:hypothetical protein